MGAPAKQRPPRFRFADLVLDTGQFRVTRDGESVKLSKLSFQTLRVLVEAAPNVVLHAELCEKVWGPQRIVTPENLAKRVMMLRKALGDHADEPRYIEGVRGHGYRLIPEVTVETPLSETSDSSGVRFESELHDEIAQHSGDRRSGRGMALHLGYGAGAVVLLILGLLFVDRMLDPVETSIERPSVAVLPFEDLSPNQDQAYFADGLSEELMNQLTQIENLRVPGRISSFAFRGRAAELETIGDALGVEYVLVGSVRRSEVELRITAALVSVADGTNLWSRTFSGDLSVLFDLQQQIATAVAQALSLELGIGPPPYLYGGTDSFAAYDHYLRGWALRDVDDHQAKTEFESAVAIDSNFARAWAGLSYAYGGLLRASTSDAQERSALERMEYTALQAVDRAPDQWDGYAAMAWVDVAKKDWISANEQLERTREISRLTGAPIDLQVYANFLHQIGRAEEALDENRAVRRLDPLNTFASFNIQIGLMLLGRYEEALAEFERNRQLPGILSAMQLWGIPWYIEQGHHDVPLGVYENSQTAALRALAEVWDSPKDAVEVIRAALDAPGYHSRNDYSQLAIFAAHLGEDELALALLRDAYLGGGYAGFFLIWHPVFGDVRKSDGFKQFARDLGFVELWQHTGNWGDYCHPTVDGDFECA